MDQDSLSTDLLFDFFYVDKERVNSLTAQLFPAGVLSTVKQTSTENDANLKEVKILLPVLGGRANASESFSRAQESLYDSSWTMPSNLLAKLQEEGRIKSDLKEAKLGDLVIISGMMKLFDVKMVSDFMPVFKKMKETELKNSRNNAEKISLKSEISGIDNALNMMSFLPSSTQIDFADRDSNLIWMTVHPENLTIGSGDIALKYGPFIPGEWHILGFIDAYPLDRIDNPEAPYPDIQHELKNSLDQMLLMIRHFLGRSELSYGMTPLLIFRKVT